MYPLAYRLMRELTTRYAESVPNDFDFETEISFPLACRIMSSRTYGTSFSDGDCTYSINDQIPPRHVCTVVLAWPSETMRREIDQFEETESQHLYMSDPTRALNQAYSDVSLTASQQDTNVARRLQMATSFVPIIRLTHNVSVETRRNQRAIVRALYEKEQSELAARSAKE